MPTKAKALPPVALVAKQSTAKRRRKQNPEDNPNPFAFHDSQQVGGPTRELQSAVKR